MQIKIDTYQMHLFIVSVLFLVYKNVHDLDNQSLDTTIIHRWQYPYQHAASNLNNYLLSMLYILQIEAPKEIIIIH